MCVHLGVFDCTTDSDSDSDHGPRTTDHGSSPTSNSPIKRLGPRTESDITGKKFNWQMVQRSDHESVPPFTTIRTPRSSESTPNRKPTPTFMHPVSLANSCLRGFTHYMGLELWSPAGRKSPTSAPARSRTPAFTHMRPINPVPLPS
ncbi:hypothetical protein LXL04_006802 [Taraxacum kok-saghyz]